MTSHNIPSSADNAVDEDVGTGEGQGTATPAAHGDRLTSGGAGEAGDQPVPAHGERHEPAGADQKSDTEGARYLEETHDIAEEQEHQRTDLSGVDPGQVSEDPRS